MSIYPITRGFAYCVFHGPGVLYDWGVKHVGKREKNTSCLALIEGLIILHDPHDLVIEDYTDVRSKRSSRVKILYRDIEALADRASLDTYSYPWAAIFTVFKEYKPMTRHDIAIVIADMLPAIKRRLPPKRKPWLPTDPRQAIFDAAALGLTHYAVHS